MYISQCVFILVVMVTTNRKAACLTPSVDKTAKMRKVEPSPLMRATSSAARNRVTAKTKSKKIVSIGVIRLDDV